MAALLCLVGVLGCGGSPAAGLHGPTDGSAGGRDGGLGGVGGGLTDGSAGSGGHAAAGAGGTGGLGGARSDGAAPDGGRSDAAAQAGSGGGGPAGAAGQGGTTGRGGAAGHADASADLGPAPGGQSGADAGGTPDAGAICDSVAQTGCPGGQKCTIPPACIPVGSVGDGQLCATGGFDDCASPDICVGDGTAHLCRQACNVNADCHQAAVPVGTTTEPNNLGRCLISIGGTNSKVCTFACNPVTAAGPTGCPAGYACQYFETTSVPEGTDCEPAGTAGENADCTTAACAGGLVCVSNGTTHRCRQVCRTGNNADCAVAGDTCLMPSGVPTPMFGFCCAASGC